MERKRLGDIVRGSTDDFKKTWEATEASTGFTPLPSGTYRCLIAGGEIFTSKAKSTPGYKITFEVTSGPHAGRKIWHDVWLSNKALSIAKAELAKLGIVQPEQLEQPLPVGLIADVTIVLRTDDDGEARNRVKKFEVVKTEVPPADFAPLATVSGREPGDDDDDPADSDDDHVDGDGSDWLCGEQSRITSHLSNGALKGAAK